MLLLMIGWQAYISVCGGGTIIYYSAAWLIYRKRHPLSIQQKIAGEEKKFTGAGHASLYSMQTTPDITLQLKNQHVKLAHSVDGLVSELKAFITQATAQDVDKENITGSLSLLLHKYPDIIDSDFKPAITNLIVAELESNSGLHLNADELAALWRLPAEAS